jgi:hypothetical protein
MNLAIDNPFRDKVMRDWPAAEPTATPFVVEQRTNQSTETADDFSEVFFGI